jgi:hypothetical protein
MYNKTISCKKKIIATISYKHYKSLVNKNTSHNNYNLKINNNYKSTEEKEMWTLTNVYK